MMRGPQELEHDPYCASVCLIGPHSLCWAASERWITLTVRRERVSGRIKLSSMWRITPLDVVTLKLKARQTELDDKQEVVALLRDKCESSQLVCFSCPTCCSEQGTLRFYLLLRRRRAQAVTIIGTAV